MLVVLFMLAVLAILVSITGGDSDSLVAEWSTAIQNHETNERKIIWRYVSRFSSEFSRESYPVRIILTWKYESETGMPQTPERMRMDKFEDLLGPLLYPDALALLAMVSTGENLREWTYYSRSEEEFMQRLNNALGEKAPFPIEIHISIDPGWVSYNEFASSVQKSTDN